MNHTMSMRIIIDLVELKSTSIVKCYLLHLPES